MKTVLKQLQQSIQTITSPGWPADEEMVSQNIADNFQWLSKDHLCILVYLVTVMHSMQAGYMDKAQKYTDKAIAQIDKIKTTECRPHAILSSFHVLLLEHIVQCRLVTGDKVRINDKYNSRCLIIHLSCFKRSAPLNNWDISANSSTTEGRYCCRGTARSCTRCLASTR